MDMQQTLQIVFPLTVSSVSSIPDSAEVMIGTCTVDMQQTLQIVFPLTVNSIPDSAGVMIGTCTVDMQQTLQTSVSINHKCCKQHPRQCWDNDWGMYGGHAADKCLHLPVVPASELVRQWRTVYAIPLDSYNHVIYRIE